MNKTLRWINLFILVALIFTSSTTAETLDDLEGQQDDVQSEIELSEEQVAQMEAELEALNTKIEELNVQILDVIAVIQDLDTQIQGKQNEIAGAKAELETAILEEAEYKDQVAKRIKVMYEYGDSGYVEVLLEADNLSDFFTRMEYLKKIMEFDENMFVTLGDIQADITARKTQLEIEEQTLQGLMADADAKKSDLDTLVAEKEEQVAIVENNKELMLMKIETLQQEEEDLKAAIAAKIEEMKALELKFKDGEFKWPVPGHYYISSYFGSRIHPIYGYPEFHNGVDIPAGYGDDILAAGAGIVIFSGYKGSYGNVVMINHGSGYMTLYAHNSELLVNEGDGVAQGTVIAKAGSTGWSTGTHLHFAIQFDGEWTDPLSYFESE